MASIRDSSDPGLALSRSQRAPQRSSIGSPVMLGAKIGSDTPVPQPPTSRSRACWLVPQLLTEALALVLTPIGTPPANASPVATLSDTEVLALAQVQMPPQQGHRLDQLLAKQREAPLTAQEQVELLALMQVYQQLWVRQSEALAEAVHRGLRAPLTP